MMSMKKQVLLPSTSHLLTQHYREMCLWRFLHLLPLLQVYRRMGEIILFYYHFVLNLGGVDFNITSNELLFTPIATQNGNVISIIDDTCVENNETFRVSLTTSDPVLFTSQSISVTILDIVDSEFSSRDSIYPQFSLLLCFID